MKRIFRIVLLAVMSVTVTAASGTQKFITTDPLPTLDEILSKYVEAIGGRTAHMRLQSRVTKGRVDVPGLGRGGRFEAYEKAPNKSLTLMEIGQIGLLRQGFDGRIGWEQSKQTGVRNTTGESLAALARDSEFHSAVNLRDRYARMKLLGKIKHGFRKVYLVEGVPRVGQPERLYFDTETGFLVRRDLMRLTARGNVPAEVNYSDWREIDGVKFPFKVTQAMPGMAFVITVEEMTHNVHVENSVFSKPRAGNR
jgi:hypothetical protein